MGVIHEVAILYKKIKMRLTSIFNDANQMWRRFKQLVISALNMNENGQTYVHDDFKQKIYFNFNSLDWIQFQL